MIETNKKKQEEIRAKEVQMQKQQADMKIQITKLQGHLGNLYEDYIDLCGLMAECEIGIKPYGDLIGKQLLAKALLLNAYY